MFGALADGTTRVTNFLQGADCLSTISCFRKLGIDIENTQEEIRIHGKGLHGLTAPTEILDTGNSGTTTRLISGILAGQNFTTTLTGDASIQSRPMGRIIKPLSMMGATVESLKGNQCAPLQIQGHPLTAIHYQSPGSFCAGEILCSACRTVCRRNYFGYRTLSFEKSYGTDALSLRRTDHQ